MRPIKDAPFRMDWSTQHCGIHRGTALDIQTLMPEVEPLLATFPKNPYRYTWDIKVHMLMPGQYPCIPGWHHDMVPRDESGRQDYSLVRPDESMYLWISGAPFTEYEGAGGVKRVEPQVWYEFSQLCRHRGTPSPDHTWRCFVRAVPATLLWPNPPDKVFRRHSQVYLDAATFTW